MKKIQVVCPAGIGTCTIMSLWLRDALAEAGVKADVFVGEALTAVSTPCDLIVGTAVFARTLQGAKVPVVGIVNVTDKKEYLEKVIPYLKEQ